MDDANNERGFLDEVRSGERYRFGRNWRSFAKRVGEREIASAQDRLAEFLAPESVADRSFLDAGCGSGLHSLAARRLGAAQVHSFDYDPDSVATTQALRARFAPDDAAWRVERGSVLDPEYLDGLAQHDLVYSWGVLHHTGAMWEALENLLRTVRPGGLLFIAIYADRGAENELWLRRKRTYCGLPAPLRPIYAFGIYGPREIRKLVKSLLKGRPGRYLERWTGYHASRGMSRLHDLLDWLGGYPYEYATPEALVRFTEARGFKTEKIREAEGLGCHELLFRREASE